MTVRRDHSGKWCLGVRGPVRTARVGALVVLAAAWSCGAPGPSWQERLTIAEELPPSTETEVLPFGLWLPVRAEGAHLASLRVAYELSLAGDAEGAFALVSHLSENSPGDASLWAARAALQRTMGFARSAERDLSKACALVPDDADLALGLAELRLELGFPTAAIEALGAAHDAGRDDVELHRSFGRAWARLGESEHARRHYDLAFARAGDQNPGLFLEAATMLSTLACRNRAKLGDSDWIENALSRALEIAPTNARAWLSRGLFHERRGEYAEALSAYERACAAEPWNRLAWTYLALAARGGSDRARFAGALERALELEADRRRARRLVALSETPD